LPPNTFFNFHNKMNLLNCYTNPIFWTKNTTTQHKHSIEGFKSHQFHKNP
jgi:hypothetical protein